jgi:hypothetical protein
LTLSCALTVMTQLKAHKMIENHHFDALLMPHSDKFDSFICQ